MKPVTKKLRQPAAKETATRVAVKVQIDPTPDAPVYYANYLEVGHSHHEFSISFARVPIKFSADRLVEIKKGMVINLASEGQVLFSPTVIPGLIRALEIQRKLYETNFGKIQTKGEEND